MNLYHIYKTDKPGTILYTAVALDPDHAFYLANLDGIDLTGYTIDFVDKDPKDASGRQIDPGVTRSDPEKEKKD